jgi:SlyX protein
MRLPQEVPMNSLSERVNTLEMTLTYQEDTIQELNSVIIDQQKAIERLSKKLSKLTSKLSELEQNATDGTMVPVEKPPHY